MTGADIPTKFTDLLDPKWKGRVATGHPAFSGYFGQLVLALRRQYGWDYFEKLAKNNPRIGRSGGDPVQSPAPQRRPLVPGMDAERRIQSGLRG